ncbi:MAG TPA: alpha/beta fold hydrolase [Alphaproteobacteria bacterium]|nr:alpha/beta fold hydrolase [Alphaproteobacteria bacterium]
MSSRKEIVVLLHGIALSKHTLWPFELYLRTQGYSTLNITYPSRNMNLDDLAGWLHSHFLTASFWDDHPKVHFVTHSMGGLLTRRYLSFFKNDIPTDKIGRVVMIGTPNKGSEVADALKDFSPYKFVFGPAGEELTTSIQEQNTDPPYYDVGVIAGDAKWWSDPFSAIFFPGPNDGKVSIERSKLEGMRDHMIVKSSHTAMIYRPFVWKQTVHFLKHGEFKHDA